MTRPRRSLRAGTTMLLALLGAAGCMTARERVTRPTTDVASAYESIAPASSECESFGCIP